MLHDPISAAAMCPDAVSTKKVLIFPKDLKGKGTLFEIHPKPSLTGICLVVPEHPKPVPRVCHTDWESPASLSHGLGVSREFGTQIGSLPRVWHLKFLVFCVPKPKYRYDPKPKDRAHPKCTTKDFESH